MTPQKTDVSVLLMHIGSPNSLKLSEIRRYLQNFLMDPLVIQAPYLIRFFIVYFIITIFRAPKTLEKYKLIWTDKGSPFLIFAEQFREQLEAELKIPVVNSMMYSRPNIIESLNQINTRKLIVIPMYPQYAESTSQSALNLFDKSSKQNVRFEEVTKIDFFYFHDFFINSFVKNIQTQITDLNKFDHVVFTYHGLPESHIRKNNDCLLTKECCNESFNSRNTQKKCYRFQCYKTTAYIASKLKLDPSFYTTCFQSRVGPTKWISPSLEATCDQLAQSGTKRILVISPSFVVDGLETLWEVKDLEISLKKKYDVELHLVSSLNSKDFWVQSFGDYIKSLV